MIDERLGLPQRVVLHHYANMRVLASSRAHPDSCPGHTPGLGRLAKPPLATSIHFNVGT